MEACESELRYGFDLIGIVIAGFHTFYCHRLNDVDGAAIQFGLARLAHLVAVPQVGYTRLAGTSPAMTAI
jgi:hypothetical protein